MKKNDLVKDFICGLRKIIDLKKNRESLYIFKSEISVLWKGENPD